MIKSLELTVTLTLTLNLTLLTLKLAICKLVTLPDDWHIAS